MKIVLVFARASIMVHGLIVESASEEACYNIIERKGEEQNDKKTKN